MHSIIADVFIFSGGNIMIIFARMSAAALLSGSLAACGGGTTSTGPQVQTPVIPPIVDPYFFGSTEGDPVPAPGLATTTSTQAERLASIRDTPLPVRFFLSRTDNGADRPELLVSNEVLTITGNPLDNDNAPWSLTLQGETADFETYFTRLSSGQDAIRVDRRFGSFSGHGGVIVTPIDPITDESYYAIGVFTFGLQTAPVVIPALNGGATMRAQFSGRGSSLDRDGRPLERNAVIDGLATLDVNFDSGVIDARIDVEAQGQRYVIVNPAIGIEGNGFDGPLNFTQATCPAGSACTSRSSIGGVFYGPAANEATGVVGFDVSVVDQSTNSGAGFIGYAPFIAFEQ